MKTVFIVMINDFPAAVGSTRDHAERLKKEEISRMVSKQNGRGRGSKLHARIWEFTLDVLDSGSGV